MGFWSNPFLLSIHERQRMLLGKCFCCIWLTGDAENTRESSCSCLALWTWEVARLPTGKWLPRVKFYFNLESDFVGTWERIYWICIWVYGEDGLWLLNPIVAIPMPTLQHLQCKLKPSGVGTLGYLSSRSICFLLCPGRHQQLPLTSILIFVLANKQRWHFSLCDSCGVACDDGPKRGRCSQLGGEQQLVTVPWLKCQVTALLYYV